MTKQIDELMQMIHLYKHNGETYERIKAAIVAALKPVGEPVGYRYKFLNFMRHEVWSFERPRSSDTKILETVPVYTSAPPAQTPAPPPRFTEHDVKALLDKSDLLDMFLHIGWYSAPASGFKKHGTTLIRDIETAVRKQFGVPD